MKYQKWIFLGLFLQISSFALASDIGDAYIKLGQKLNQNTLNYQQIQDLYLKLNEAESILNGWLGAGGFTCIQGTVYGPNNQQIWTGNSNVCSDSTRILIQGDYACVDGTLYGVQGKLKWTGNSYACGDKSRVKIGNHYACVDGYIYGPGGFEKWTGDSNYCASAILN
jgi:hypothetical protein